MTRVLSWRFCKFIAPTDLDEGDEVLHVFDDLRDGEIFKDVLTYPDDLANLGLVKCQEEGRGAL